MALEDPQLQQLVEKYLQWDKNEKTHNEIAELLVAKDEPTLRKRMLGKLAFGTAGIRARMGAGFAQLNDLTIIQISNGFARHVIEVFGPNPTGGICVGYDGRFNSKRFALLASNVFVRNGIPVKLFSDCVPTPVVSFATAALKCNAGLIITASHNPKEDNGYKAYWSNGAQVFYEK